MIQTLIKAASAGGEAALRELPYAEMEIIKAKGDFATTADLRSQEEIIKILSREFSKIKIIAEEGIDHEVTTDNFFTVDPFDGTIIGNRGCLEWGVLLSYVENFVPKLSVLYQPALSKMIIADVKGKCELVQSDNQKKNIIISGGKVSNSYAFCIDLCYSSSETHINKILLPLVSKNKIFILRTLGAAISAGMDLLEGVIDVYISHTGKIWDYAPVVAAIISAGGCAYTLDSETLKYRDFKCEHKFNGVLLSRSKEIAEDIFNILGAKQNT